jgi:hypothetical protein
MVLKISANSVKKIRRFSSNILFVYVIMQNKDNYLYNGRIKFKKLTNNLNTLFGLICEKIGYLYIVFQW